MQYGAVARFVAGHLKPLGGVFPIMDVLQLVLNGGPAARSAPRVILYEKQENTVVTCSFMCWIILYKNIKKT